MTPIELPTTASGLMPSSSRYLSAPTWCAPSAAPPPRTKTRFCRFAAIRRRCSAAAGGPPLSCLDPPLHLVDLLHDHLILVVWVPAEFHGCAEEDVVAHGEREERQDQWERGHAQQPRERREAPE